MMLNKIKVLVGSLFFSTIIVACGLSPQNADIDINRTLPEAKATVYSDGVRKLGMLGAIFNRPTLNVMSKEIADNTGTSSATGGEIPRNITEMVKSTLNGIGGAITFVPYDPEFMSNNAALDYSKFENKTIPQVIVSGGITEFDRGLVTKGDGIDAGFDLGGYGLEGDDKTKGSLAQVTLDFNLLDFQRLAAIPRIQSINSIKLHKSTKEDSIGFTIKGVSFGANGSIKKVQGRHAAVRLLVQLSMMQLIGRYQKLPYWNLLPGIAPDNIVLDAIKEDFAEMTSTEQTAEIQTLLYLQGLSVNITGENDSLTTHALKQFSVKNNLASPGINSRTYIKLFETMPITIETKIRRKALTSNPQLVVSELSRAVMPAAVVDDSAAIVAGDLKVWTNKKSYAIGEQMTVSFSAKKPMYVRIVWINSKGERSTLFPNPFQTDNYIKSGQTYQIPPRNGNFTVDIGAPTGIDKIRAVGSIKGVSSDVLHFTNAGEFDDEKMHAFPVRFATDITIK